MNRDRCICKSGKHSIHCPAVAQTQPNAMINSDGEKFYPDCLEDAAWFAEQHGARMFNRRWP